MYINDPFNLFGKVILISQGIFDPSTNDLIATVSFEFEIGVLKRLIESSINPEYMAEYAIYDTVNKDLVASNGLELSLEKMNNFTVFHQLNQLTIGNTPYYCQMELLSPGEIGNHKPPSYQPQTSFADAMHYILYPNDKRYLSTYDFQVFLCHDYTSLASFITNLDDEITHDMTLSQLYIYLMTFLCFTIITYSIFKFTNTVTKPITHLTMYTKRYKKAKELDEKSKVIEDISEDEIFKATKIQIERQNTTSRETKSHSSPSKVQRSKTLKNKTTRKT